MKRYLYRLLFANGKQYIGIAQDVGRRFGASLEHARRYAAAYVPEIKVQRHLARGIAEFRAMLEAASKA